MQELTGKIVELNTVDALYVGKLIEINENEVYLQTEMGWVVIPVEKIASLSEKQD